MTDLPRPILETAQLLLRPFQVVDAPDVERLAGDRRVADSTQTIPHPYPEGAAVPWIEQHKAEWVAQLRLSLAITTEEHGLVGACALRLVPEHSHAELGYWIGVPFWGRGFASEAGRAIVKYAFDVLDYRRIFARHFACNPASGAVMKKIGMREEGIMRQHVMRRGKVHDVVFRGVLRSEFHG